jgi:Tol biopolymer transport system component
LGITWLTNDKVVIENTKGKIFRIDNNGAHRTMLTLDEHNNGHASGCGDGRHVVFESFRSVDNIWKMDADGSNLIRLTHGDGEFLPDCSPDGKWIVYVDTSKAFSLSRLSIEGGEAVQLGQATGPIRISPDGKRIAYFTLENDPSPRLFVLVIDADSGQKLSSADPPPDASYYSWAPDGRALDFVVTRNAVSNLLRQPLTGGPARQITNFKSGRIFSSAWSPDGTQLALARGQTGADVVLIARSK